MANKENSLESQRLWKELRLRSAIVNDLELCLTAELVKHYHLYRSRFWSLIRNSIAQSVIESVK